MPGSLARQGALCQTRELHLMTVPQAHFSGIRVDQSGRGLSGVKYVAVSDSSSHQNDSSRIRQSKLLNYVSAL